MGCGASARKYPAKTVEEIAQANTETEGPAKPLLVSESSQREVETQQVAAPSQDVDATEEADHVVFVEATQSNPALDDPAYGSREIVVDPSVPVVEEALPAAAEESSGKLHHVADGAKANAGEAEDRQKSVEVAEDFLEVLETVIADANREEEALQDIVEAAQERQEVPEAVLADAKEEKEALIEPIEVTEWQQEAPETAIVEAKKINDDLSETVEVTEEQTKAPETSAQMVEAAE